jgi:group II intron reverse transcriptase/maturase
MELLPSNKLALIRQRARRDPTSVFTSLAHLLDVEFLRGCYAALGKEKAPGIDGQRWRDYGRNLDENLCDLVARLKAKRYRPLPAKRVYIPKGDKGVRPLGLPAIEDKIVQKGIVWILQAIYEVDFCDCSYGFRPGRSCHQALRAVNEAIMNSPVHYVIEADIQGFFDHVSHDWMMKFLQVRIRDSSLLLLIRRFLKAGYIDSGLLVRNDEGTPQGGPLSPMLANIFLHYVLDLWFERCVRPQVPGQCHLVRYADDFLILVQSQDQAQRIEKALQQRLAKFGLTLHPEKTRTLSFGRFERDQARRENRRPNTFEFLGFTHYCGTSRGGWFLLGRKTAKKRLARACRKLSLWLKTVRPLPMKVWWPTLAAKLRGHYQYYGLSGNGRAISTFDYQAKRLLAKWLNRRSQCKSFTWKQLNAYLAKYPLPTPRIVHKFY